MNTKDNSSMFKFSNPKLENLIFFVNNDSVKQKEINFRLDVKYKKIKIVDDNKTTNVLLTVSNINNDCLIDSSDPFGLSITMSSNFQWPKLTNDDEDKNFLSINSPSLILSYVRTIVSQITGSSKFGMQTIPFIDFTTAIIDNDD